MFPKFLKVSSNFGFLFNESFYLYDFHQDTLDFFAKALRFSYEAVLPPEGNEIGQRLPNGTWTGVLGMLQRREIDMAFCEIIMDEETNKEFRLIYPHTAYETTFVTKKHEPAPVMAYFLQPFSIQVWLAIISCVFLLPFLFHNLLRRKHSIVSLLNSTLGSLVGQGLGITPRRSRDYFVLASWILSSALLYHFYAAVLLSFLMFPPLHGVRTIDDLANGIKEGTYECATYPDTSPIPRYLNQHQPENPSVRVIVNNLHYHRLDDFFHYLETYAGDKKPAFVAVRHDFVYYEDFYFISDENFFGVTGTYAVRKDFCCGSALDKVVHLGWASGFFKKFHDDGLYFNFGERRNDISQTLEGFTWKNLPAEGKLTLNQLKGSFIFLIASHSLAFLVFLIEICTEKFAMLERFKNLNSKWKKSSSLTAVLSGVVLGLQATKRKKRRLKK